MLLPNSPPSASAPFSPPIDVVSPTPDGPPSDYDEEGTRGADPFLYTPELPPNGGPRPTSVFQSAVLDALDKAIATGLMGPNFRKNPNVSKVDRPRPDSLDRSFYPKEDKHFWVVTCGTIVGIFNKWSTASSAAHSDDDTSIKACLTWDSAVKHYEKAFDEDRIAVGPFKKQKIRDAPQSNPKRAPRAALLCIPGSGTRRNPYVLPSKTSSPAALMASQAALAQLPPTPTPGSHSAFVETDSEQEEAFLRLWHPRYPPVVPSTSAAAQSAASAANPDPSAALPMATDAPTTKRKKRPCKMFVVYQYAIGSDWSDDDLPSVPDPNAALLAKAVSNATRAAPSAPAAPTTKAAAAPTMKARAASAPPQASTSAWKGKRRAQVKPPLPPPDELDDMYDDDTDDAILTTPKRAKHGHHGHLNFDDEIEA